MRVMNKGKTIFSQIMSLIPKRDFKACVDRYKGNIDGVQTGCYPKSSDKVKLAEGQWSFDRPFYLILNQSLGYGNWHAPNTVDIYETYFDWVRVYQKE